MSDGNLIITSYLQNPAAKEVQTERGSKMVNPTRGLRQHLMTRHPGDIDVPIEASPLLPTILNTETLRLVAALKELFKQRPIWIRRGLVKSIDESQYNVKIIKYAIPHVAYTWKAGPWRDCYVRFGVDPRTNIAYADYQAIYCTAKATSMEGSASANVV